MYAVVELGGRQWKVEPGTRLQVNRMAAATGSEHVADRVLFAHDGTKAQAGRPYVEDAKVVCEVLDHPLGPKEISYHFRRRENWRRTKGHRQPLTRLVVRSIICGGVTAGEAPAKARKPAAARSHPAASQASAPAASPSSGRVVRTSALKPQIKSLAKKPVTRTKPAAPKDTIG